MDIKFSTTTTLTTTTTTSIYVDDRPLMIILINPWNNLELLGFVQSPHTFIKWENFLIFPIYIKPRCEFREIPGREIHLRVLHL